MGARNQDRSILALAAGITLALAITVAGALTQPTAMFVPDLMPGSMVYSGLLEPIAAAASPATSSVSGGEAVTVSPLEKSPPPLDGDHGLLLLAIVAVLEPIVILLGVTEIGMKLRLHRRQLFKHVQSSGGSHAAVQHFCPRSLQGCSGGEVCVFRQLAAFCQDLPSTGIVTHSHEAG